MRILKNTLYINQEDVYLSLDGETVVAKKEKEVLLRVPLHNLEAIISHGYNGASPRLMQKCAKENIKLVFLDTVGRFLARVEGETKGSVHLRVLQVEKRADSNFSLDISKNFILAKVYNSRWVLERAIREYSMRMEVELIQEVSEYLYQMLPLIRNCEELEELRGYEGNCAGKYFSVLDMLILNQKEDFFFYKRSKRPPLDRVNCLLSYFYTLLSFDIAAALEMVGLDPYIGFMHTDRSGRRSLAVDIEEELRAVMVDRFVLTMINKRIVKASDFETQDSGAVILKEDARKTLLNQWQMKKNEELTHPYLKEKMKWGLIPYSQALLLAKYLRDELDEYPAFLWK
ncbi:MAG: type I-C CRISPR-associated endonuclease Cas1c [Peptostreptococcaceae bacterium]|nr:type I-C CRISPR-associated endonuclease Cas1c [Peptostreptococcaceae bacterium]